MDLKLTLLKQNYLHSLIINGIDVEANTEKYNKAAERIKEFKLDTTVEILGSLILNDRFISTDETSGKFELGNLEVINAKGTPTEIGNISVITGNIIGEIYQCEGVTYFVYRRNSNSDMSRSLAHTTAIVNVVKAEFKF